MPERASGSVLVAAVRHGALAGLVATVPMTLVMLAGHRLFEPRQAKLPPRLITDRLLGRKASDEAGRWHALAAHFGFGAATGALFALWPPPSVGKGVVFGLAVWAVSYLGWVPGLRLMPPATRQPARRNAIMIAAHVAWGLALGGVVAGLARRGLARSSHGSAMVSRF